jgi:hypothetical protein
MSENILGEVTDAKSALRNQGMWLMLKGAVLGGFIFFGTLIFVWVLYLVGLLLPEQSKQMPDPINRGAIEAPVETVRTV